MGEMAESEAVGAAHGRRAARVGARPDHELLEAARDGSTDAAEVLIDRHWDRAYRIAVAVLGDAHAAEDVTQEAMLIVLQKAALFDRRRRFGPWLHRIVANRALDALRARRRRDEVAIAVAPTAPAPASDPRLADALGALPPEQRVVVVLRHVGGYGTNEIARMLRLRRGTVGSRLRRGLDRLREELDDGDR